MPTMERITRFADWVRQRRKILDLTQAALAERVGCAVVTIKKIEQEVRRPSRQVAELLAEHLSIPAAERDAFLRLARGEYVEALVSAVNIASPSALPQPPNRDASSSLFVARERELAQLDTHLIATLNGSGRIVFITGEAGRGKTTLMAEFALRAQERYSDLVVANGKCDAYAGIGDPFLPFRDVMALLIGSREANWDAGALPTEQARRLLALLPRTLQSILERGPDLVDIFASASELRQQAQVYARQAPDRWLHFHERLDTQQLQAHSPPQRQLFEQYTQVLSALAGHVPLLLVLDDLQWIDTASAGLIFHLGRRLSNSRLMILCAYRPSEVALPQSDQDEPTDLHPLIPAIHELKRRYGDIEVDLGRLSPQAGRAFVDALLDREPNLLGEYFRDSLFQRTHGHPLFTVELLRDMQERQDLLQNEKGRWVEGGSVDWEALPSRVEAVIAWRIGRLPFQLQESLKLASVEGETFTAEVVARVQAMDEQQMVRRLSSVADRQHRLVRSEGIERMGQQSLSRYRFGHILFQKYLYESLDAPERVYLHEAVGRALENLYGEERADAAVQLAHHFEKAGLTAKAVEYLYLAAERAVRLSAHEEAIVHLSRGVALLRSLPENVERTRIDLQFQIALGISFAVVKGWSAPEAGHAYEQAREMVEQVGDPSQLGSILWGLYVYYIVRGELHTAHELGEQCLQLTQNQDDSPLLVVSHFMVGVPSFHLGRLEVAQEHLEEGRVAYLPVKHDAYISRYGPDFGVFSAAYESHLCWYLGYPEQALRQSQDTVDLAQALGHPYSLVLAQSYAAMLQQLCGDWSGAQAWAEGVLALCTAYEFPYYAAWTSFLQGWAMTKQGKLHEGIVQMQQGLAHLHAMETGLRESYYLGLLAEAHTRAGQVEEGLDLLVEALAWVDEREERYHEAELYRLRGELLYLRDETNDESERCFHRAIDIARQQQAKSLELRAVMSLSRHWQRQEKADAAHYQLSAIYNWFTEGFDTPDLQDAKALLDELSR
jgi:predicted ATPase/transcriptional regulator with XRE-family HTH domain